MTAQIPDDKALALEHIKLYLDTYKHHFDLYIKAHVLVFAILGAIAGFLFRKELLDGDKFFLAALASAGSAAAIAGSIISYQWLTKVHDRILELEHRLDGQKAFPFVKGAQAIVRVFAAVSIALFVVSVQFAIRSL